MTPARFCFENRPKEKKRVHFSDENESNLGVVETEYRVSPLSVEKVNLPPLQCAVGAETDKGMLDPSSVCRRVNS